MELKKATGIALREARKDKHLTQEDFVGVSGRTYLSEIERGLKSPTLDKLDQLARHIGIHPLALLVACYVRRDMLTTASPVEPCLECILHPEPFRACQKCLLQRMAGLALLIEWPGKDAHE
ncbi:helix-turn-helix domain-containing protein [Pseudomonas syringae]|nr:helix-turn-helix transcriptional regulator [Pseudomonas syringae]